MDNSKMNEEQMVYFLYGYMYALAQDMHSEFPHRTIKEWLDILIMGAKGELKWN